MGLLTASLSLERRICGGCRAGHNLAEYYCSVVFSGASQHSQSDLCGSYLEVANENHPRHQRGQLGIFRTMVQTPIASRMRCSTLFGQTSWNHSHRGQDLARVNDLPSRESDDPLSAQPGTFGPLSHKRCSWQSYCILPDTNETDEGLAFSWDGSNVSKVPDELR